ncbi:Pfs domain protein, partial [Periconia macrospinosa]
MTPRLHRSQYTVGWICAVSIELAAARGVLDEMHEEYRSGDCIFTLGSIAGHNIVIACLPAGQLGISPAATVASRTLVEFPQIKFGLMVGIGGGVPGHDRANSVRLGDVVVSQPQGYHGGVIQYDSGKATPDGFERTTQLDSPPTILLSALNLMKAKEAGGFSNFYQHIAQLENNPRTAVFRRDNAGEDILFDPDYDHTEGEVTCDHCSKDMMVQRAQREKGSEVRVHYGNIASGNLVIKSAKERDRISQLLRGILCFEMEAAGLMNHFKCLVIRGICDYADSHKNKTWQPYAAGTAAAYAKELLLNVPTET